MAAAGITSLGTVEATCPRCDRPVSIPLTLSQVPVVEDYDRRVARFRVTAPAVDHHCDDEEI